MGVFYRWIALTIVWVMTLGPGSIARAELSPAEQDKIFKAAGFQQAPNGQYIHCKEDPPTLSYSPGRIKTEDLNGDGHPEAWITEASLFCYGNTAEYFVLLSKGSGEWRVLLDSVGVATVLPTKRSGWPDIEVGGPGFGQFPVYRWSGKGYVLAR